MARYTIGVDIGGTKIAAALFDPELNLCAGIRVATPQDLEGKDFFDHIRKILCSLLAENNLSLSDIEGIGFGLPGSIRYPDGYISVNSNIPKLAGFAAGDYLNRIFPGIKTCIANDAQAAALGESRMGAGQGFKNMLYCAVSTGISSAMVINGELYRGSDGYAGESGHMLIAPGINDGVYCSCGNDGCLMSFCSGHMIVQHVKRELARDKESVLHDLMRQTGELTTREILRAWEQGDALAAQAIRQMQHYLAVWLFNVYVFVNINCFVLGGGLLKMGEHFWQGVYSEFYSYKKTDSVVCFKQAALGDQMGVVGARELLR